MKRWIVLMTDDSANADAVPPKDSALRDSVVYFTAQIGARALNFFYFMILAWSLPIDEFGILNYALSILITIDILIDMGLSRHAMREMAKTPEMTGEFITRIMPYKLIAALLVYIGLWMWLSTSDKEMTYQLIFLVSAFGLFFMAPAMLMENVLQAHHKFSTISSAHVALSIVQFAVGGAILLLGGSTIAIAITFTVTYIVYASFMGWGVWRIRPTLIWGKHIEPLIRSLPAAFPYLCSALIVLLAIRAEFLVLGRYGSPADLGVFGMATKIVEAGLLLPIALGTVLAPRFAKAHVMADETLRKLYLSGIEVLLLLAMPAAVIAYGLAPVMPVILSDPEFAPLDDVLRLLFWGYPAACLFLFNTTLLFGAVRQRWPLLLLIVLAGLQIAINILLQSRYGIWGAAASFNMFMGIAAVVSTVFILALYTGRTGFMRSLIVPVLCSVVGIVPLMLFPARYEPAAIITALILYALVALAMRRWLPWALKPSFQV